MSAAPKVHRHTERVKIPNVSDSAGLAGVSGDKLVIDG